MPSFENYNQTCNKLHGNRPDRRLEIMSTQISIEDVQQTDLEEVLALNQSEVPHLGSVNIEQMRWFSKHAHYFRVAKVDQRLAGFLVGLRPGSSYQSLNYRWFCDRYAEFAYVDRIAVAPPARGLRIASKLYDDFTESLPETVKILTCEVNVIPPNDGSMRFHARLEFREVGTLSTENGDKKVALLLKDL